MNTIIPTKFVLVFLIIIISTKIRADSLDINSTSVISSNPHISQLSADPSQEAITSLSTKLEDIVALVYSGFFVLASGILFTAAWQNTVTMPIGFIYVQLPNQESPKEIWPQNTWKDISSEYANLFFRVEGSQTAAWGKIQDDNAPRVIRVESCKGGEDSYLGNSLWTNSWTDCIFSGSQFSAKWKHHNSIKFETSGGEVKPRNVAMRIWKRIE